jgi:hypothetical protein
LGRCNLSMVVGFISQRAVSKIFSADFRSFFGAELSVACGKAAQRSAINETAEGQTLSDSAATRAAYARPAFRYQHGEPLRMRIFFPFNIQFSRSGILCGATFTMAIPQRNAGSGEFQETAPRFTISCRM